MIRQPVTWRINHAYDERLYRIDRAGAAIDYRLRRAGGAA
jgi:hypothetical protein